MLKMYGYDVQLRPMPLGYAGTIYNCNLSMLQDLGLQRTVAIGVLKKLHTHAILRLSAFPGASPKQPWYRRPGWPLRSIYIVSRQSLYLLDPPSAHIPSSEKPGNELPTDCSRGSRLNHRLGGPVGNLMPTQHHQGEEIPREQRQICIAS